MHRLCGFTDHRSSVVEQKELLQLREERLAGPPVPLMQAVQLAKDKSDEQSPDKEPVGDPAYRQVEATGRFEKARSIFVGPRTRSVYGVTEKGFQVITPFVLSDERQACPTTSSTKNDFLFFFKWYPRSASGLCVGKLLNPIHVYK